LTAIPLGNVTDAFCRSDVANAVGRSGACGTCTSTSNPAGESATDVSGCTLIDGLNANRSHPVIPGIVDDASTNEPGSSHASVAKVEVNGPVHDVGNVNNGVWAPPLGHVEPVDVPLKLKQLPRNESWLGSAGTPHNVTEIPVNGNNVDTFADVVLNPYPEPVFTVTSNIEFANKTFAPNCAGSPAGGTTLYKGTEIPPLLILIVKIPT
jgi:hypothetical protein